MKVPTFLSRAASLFLETSFPTQCAACGGVVDESPFASICVDCAPKTYLIESPRCFTCGFPFYGDTESHDSCMHCEHLSPAYGRGCSVALFRGPVRALLHALKYERGFWALRDIGQLLERSSNLAEHLEEGAVLVPVPLHPRKLRERGYNQSELIVNELSRGFPQCSSEDLLARVVDTVSQTRFNRQDRIRNLKNAFSLRPNRAIDRAKRYVVVDDVFTTGSTLNACAAALRRAGARRVDVLTIGHG